MQRAPPTEIYTLSLHDALPILDIQITLKQMLRDFIGIRVNRAKKSGMVNKIPKQDRKSGSAGMPRPMSYAVFCLKKKTNRRSAACVDTEDRMIPRTGVMNTNRR